MRIALSQIIAPRHTLADFFREARECGYDGVELSLKPQGEGPLHFDLSPAELDAIRAQAAAAGLSIDSLAISAAGGNMLAGGSDAADSVRLACRGLEIAARLGAKVCLHTLGRLTADLYYEDAYNNARAAVTLTAATAARLQVAFAIEFVWNGFLFSPLEMRDFIDATGSPWVGFYFDPGNMAVFQYPEHWVRALGQRIKHVHLKDWKGRALNGGWTALQAGEVNFAAIMRELRRAGYDGPLVSEVDASLASWTETAQSMRAIAQL